MTRSSAPRRDFAAMQARRRRAARLFAAGKRSQAEIARELDISRQSVSRWYAAWRQDKPNWIRGAGRAGRRPQLDKAQLKQVDKALRQGAQAHGLERELTDLQTVSDVSIRTSSLGVLLGQTGTSTEVGGPLLEPAPLNAEQRTAVRQALSEPLTVITGPPGTGKSQVVTSILVNAAWRGLRVLFASKNNKAVDVVMERINGLSPQPILLRLGTRSLQQELANQLTAILSARATEEERSGYTTALMSLQNENSFLEMTGKQIEELVGLRNRVDNLERACEDARRLLPERVFREADQCSFTELEVNTENLKQAILRSDRSQVSFLEKLVWKFLEKSRQEQVETAAGTLLNSVRQVGTQQPSTSSPDQLVTAGSDLMRAVKSAASYQITLRELATKPQLGDLAKQVAHENKKVAELSGEAWRNWAYLLPDRLNKLDRAALGDYAGILRTIAKSDEEGGNIAKQVWRRYYELASKTTKALPCWAVTSLSARGRVPFVAAEFDLVVIDEASQCDIASALPLPRESVSHPCPVQMAAAIQRLRDPSWYPTGKGSSTRH